MGRSLGFATVSILNAIRNGRRYGLEIMDDTGTLLAAGERGEVVIQGPNVVPGYENNPEANAKSYTNGWFRTGDQGFLDEDGYLYLTLDITDLLAAP